MLAKRKFQKLVDTYSDQSISVKKTFTENLVVTGECTLPDSINISLGPSTIPQSSIISTSGWIYDTFTELIGSVSDLVDDLTNNTFGFLTNTDTISQNQIDQTTENGWISGMYTGLTTILAPKYSPTFSGEMTFPDGKIISQTTEDTTFWNNVELNGTVSFTNTSTTITDYALHTNGIIDNLSLTGNVSFPDGSLITPTLENTTFWSERTLYNTTLVDTSTEIWTYRTILDFLTTSVAASTYLATSTASSTYLTQSSASSTYAPKASPTFTGTISLNGNVTLASASANTITLNDHLVLCTGSNFTTPLSGQQGYMITGANATDLTSITSGSPVTYSTINLSYGVWIVFGQIGYINNNASGGASASISSKFFGIHSATSISLAYANKYNVTNSLAATLSGADNFSRIVTVTSVSTPYYFVGQLTYTGGPIYTNTSHTNFTAVRIA